MEPAPNYRSLFWRSSHHLWLGLLTLGLGFASGSGLGLIIGGALYALGHVFWSDTKWFRQSIDGPREAAELAAAQARIAAFEEQRARLIDALSRERRSNYQNLAAVCRDITSASAENSAPSSDLALSLETRLRKLDELLWTYLRLLTIAQSLEVFLETERREKLPEVAAEAEQEIAELEAELADAPKDAAHETRRKLLASRRDRLHALRQRLARVDQAHANLDLAFSEQERLVEQAKLIRADAVAHKNAEALGARIDISIEHLTETNRWLSELSEFKDLTNQLPDVHAGTMLVPPVPRTARQTEAESNAK